MNIDIIPSPKGKPAIQIERSETFFHNGCYYMRCDEGRIVNLSTGTLFHAAELAEVQPIKLKIVLDQ